MSSFSGHIPMRSRLNVLLRIAAPIAALIAAVSAASGVRAADREPWTFVTADGIRSHVEFLAGDLLEGRATATRGHDIAAAYVAAQFRQGGLQPPQGESFFQSVPLVEATAVLPGSSAEWVVENKSHSFEYGTHYLPSADFVSASSTLSAPLTFAGFGVDATELGYNDFSDVDVQGRIAVIFSGAPAKFSNDQRAYYSWNNTKYSTLIARGAVGVVVVDSADDARFMPWDRTVAMSWTPQMRWLDEGGRPQDAFQELKLRFRFTQEAAARLFAGAERSFDEVLLAAQSGEPQGFNLPGLLTLSATTGLRRTESANVIAVLPGSDPQLKNEYVVLSAHLDHLGRGAAVNGDSIYNGAHDNALGVGMLLEMVRALRESGVKPRRSLIFAAVTAAEKGQLGSDYFAQHPPVPAAALVADINIDTPMLFAPMQDFVALGAEHSSLGTAARAAAISQGYKLSPDPAPELVGFVRSDQFSFVRQGIPALALNGGYKARDRDVDGAELRRNFLERHHHQPSDDLTTLIHYAGAADLARVNLRIILDVANATTRPRWKPGDFFAEKFVRQQQ
jgi:hypothetical protein